jgi:hypothetical protein
MADPKASTGEKAFAIGTDVLSVVGVGLVLKGVKVVAGGAKVAAAAARAGKAAKVGVRAAEVAGDGLKAFHGTGIADARALLAGAPLDAAKAAARKVDGAAGFFLATHKDSAVYFALRRAPGGVLEYNLTSEAVARLTSEGAVLEKIPAGGMRGGFPGHQFFIPSSAFGSFNELLTSGHITITPAP